MDTLLLLARLALAAVFAAAGVGKMLDLSGSVAAVQGFGLPAKFARPIGIALPFVELLAAVLLIPVSTALAGALIAGVLLVGFLGGMVNSLRKGERPDCHCFGQLHSEPVGPSTIIRNGVLLLVALFIVTGGGSPGHSLLGWRDGETTLVQVVTFGLLVALLALAAQTWVLIHLLGQNGRLLLRMDALETARPEPQVPAPAPQRVAAPSFSASGLDGEQVTLEQLRAPGRPVILLFTDPTCGPCQALMPDVARWQRDHANRLTVAVVTRGSMDDAKAKAAQHGLARVAVEHNKAVSKLFNVTGTPAAILIDQNGAIASDVAAGAEAIRALVSNAAAVPSSNGAPRQVARPQTGQPAPTFSLPDRSGTAVASDALQGQESLLIFWNPGCGFCRRLQPDLIAWSERRPERAPSIVAVTSGTEETTADMAFADRILLDQGFATGRLFGASGTPSAVLVDTEGKIASDLAVGGPSILALLDSRNGA
jgi:thiol-disulfide isomerase/thioredoxin/uncharacterized membrane protein YphA (DoxX/SURF4 family)